MSGFMSLKLLDENNNTNDDICYYPVENLVKKDFNTLKLNEKIRENCMKACQTVNIQWKT